MFAENPSIELKDFLGINSSLLERNLEGLEPIATEHLSQSSQDIYWNYLETVQQGLENPFPLQSIQEDFSFKTDVLTGQSPQAVINPPDRVGDLPKNAKAIRVRNTARTYTEWVGSSDLNDYYRLFISKNYTFSLNLDGLMGDADVELLANNGQTSIATSINNDTTPESITQPLNAGTYYIRVFSYRGDTNYNLTVSITDLPPPPPSFSNIYGYGLVDAAAAVARSVGQKVFAEVPDIGGNSWSNDRIKAPEVWAQNYTGKGVTVAVIDDGVDILHEDLRNNIWTNRREIEGNGIDDDSNGYIDDVHGWNFTTGVGGNSGNVRPESVYSKHGTHVAGTIAASNNGVGATGVAYDASIMALKIANTTSDRSWVDKGNLAQAIRYAVDNGARVINMSLRWIDSSGLWNAVAYAASHNVITVMAASNEGLPSPMSAPARYATQYGLTVGAVDANNRIASFSNRAGSNHTMQYVVAPGVNIYSTVPGHRYEGGWSGTSMASPHVAGVVALMIGANPYLTHEQVRDYITGTAIELG